MAIRLSDDVEQRCAEEAAHRIAVETRRERGVVMTYDLALMGAFIDEETGIRVGFKGAVIPTQEDVRRVTRQAWIRHVLWVCSGNLSRAARVTGLDRSNIRRLAREAGVPPGRAH